MAEWLGFQAFTARAQVQSLVGELRFCKLYSTAEKKKKKKTFHTFSSFTRWAAAGRGEIIAVTATSPPNTTSLFL